MGILSIILGIAGIALNFAVPFVGLILGVIGIIIGRRAMPGAGTVGFILSVIAVIIGVIQIIAMAACAGVAFGCVQSVFS